MYQLDKKRLFRLLVGLFRTDSSATANGHLYIKGICTAEKIITVQVGKKLLKREGCL
ncbi:hypothetical protein JOC54_002315 [Alkalihalobacillus xiaoxiensis]|uniref:Uncharacterized protein n=1 Tax=Shouchella xiaoxiensis TaxID=766895 RepID=A0ABS2SUW8_9BACI|nr:hypothetical protein [Shouchella xiaoxiensis]